MKIEADIEADGLIDYKKLNIYPKNIWCIVCRETDTDNWFYFVPPEYENHAKGWISLVHFRKWAEAITEWCGHNFLSYDAPVLNHLLGTKIKVSQIVDTLIMSKMRSVNRLGGHSLKALGAQLGCKKIDFDDFTQFSEEQLIYCKQDVIVLSKVRKHIEKELKGWSERSIRLEHQARALFDKQQKNGFYLDERKARMIYAVCKADADQIEMNVNDQFLPRPQADKEFTPRGTIKGLVARNSVGGMPLDQCRIDAPFTRIVWKPFNIKSPKEKLIRLNEWWKPTVKTKSGKSWQLCEENLATLPPEAPQGLKDLARWAILNSRCNAIWKEPAKGKPHGSWLGNLGEDGRVHPYQDNLGAYTQRSAHRGPNIANIPGIKDRQGRPAIMGKECRECWTVKDPLTHCIIGTDAAGIQLRALAHYINVPEFTKAVIQGDIHTDNMNNLNKIGEEVCKKRAIAKTFIYAWLMGCAAYKVSLILGCSLATAKEAIKSFIANTPGLEEFIYKKKLASKRGYMIGIDGRRIPIPSEFLAMPCYLQGFEAVIMKQANVLWDAKAISEGLFFLQCANVHDEWQTEALIKEADKLGTIQVQSIIRAGEMFNVNCPQDGEYKIGASWAETH